MTIANAMVKTKRITNLPAAMPTNHIGNILRPIVAFLLGVGGVHRITAWGCLL